MSALAVDLYALTMVEAYLRAGKQEPATFSVYVRDLPPSRGYLISAGLPAVVEYLRTWRFAEDDLEFLAGLGRFTQPTLDYLAKARFEGDLRAMPEGRAFFREEPIIEITAPLPIGQLLEAAVLNLVQLPVLIASKASRCVEAAQGRPVVDFSLRRTHGIEASLTVARASYLAGFVATSNVWAGHLHAIDISGTMAHSFVQAHADELEAFRGYVRAFPEEGTLLVDTYDAPRGIANAVVVAKELKQAGHELGAIRLDSGDLLVLSRTARSELDKAGLPDVRILASGGLDEYQIERLVNEGAMIDGFGVGTQLGVSADAPALDIVYKLVSYDGRPALKLSSGKQTWIDAKQVWRRSREDGTYVGDILSLAEESVTEAEPLLEPVMRGGKLVIDLPTLMESRARWKKEYALLPAMLRRIRRPGTCPLDISAGLRNKHALTVTELRRRQGLA